MARDSVLVATITALYNATGLEAEEGILISAEKLFTDFNSIYSYIISDYCLW